MNTSTKQRDHVAQISKSNNDEAYRQSKQIIDPWFRVQALAYVARYSKDKTIKYSNEAIKIAKNCDDDYKRVAVLTWVIAALAETKNIKQANDLLSIALIDVKNISPISSKAEAMLLLLHVAFKVGEIGVTKVYKAMSVAFSVDDHWRCKRAIKESNMIIKGELKPRDFF